MTHDDIHNKTGSYSTLSDISRIRANAIRPSFAQNVKFYLIVSDSQTRAVHRSRSAGAPVHFAGAGAGVGKLQQKLRQTKL